MVPPKMVLLRLWTNVCECFTFPFSLSLSQPLSRIGLLSHIRRRTKAISQSEGDLSETKQSLFFQRTILLLPTLLLLWYPPSPPCLLIFLAPFCLSISRSPTFSLTHLLSLSMYFSCYLPLSFNLSLSLFNSICISFGILRYLCLFLSFDLCLSHSLSFSRSLFVFHSISIRPSLFILCLGPFNSLSFSQVFLSLILFFSNSHPLSLPFFPPFTYLFHLIFFYHSLHHSSASILLIQANFSTFAYTNWITNLFKLISHSQSFSLYLPNSTFSVLFIFHLKALSHFDSFLIFFLSRKTSFQVFFTSMALAQNCFLHSRCCYATAKADEVSPGISYISLQETYTCAPYHLKDYQVQLYQLYNVAIILKK